jgi:VWFA-related protein
MNSNHPLPGWAFLRPARHLIALAVSGTLAIATVATSPETTPRATPERVEVRLAQMAILAKDRKGNPVDDLVAEEIVVKDRGNKMRVAFLEPFVRESGPGEIPDVRLFVAAPGSEEQTTRSTDAEPQYLILVIDVEHDYRLLKPQAIEHCTRFVRERLQPGDRVAVFSYNGQLNEELMFTTNPDELAAAVMRAYDRPPRPQLDTRARTKQLIDDFQNCSSGDQSGTAVGQESCARQVALEYTDEMRPGANDFLDALDAVIRFAGGLQSRATVIALSHGAAMNPANVVVEAARAAYGNTDVLAGLRLEIGTGEGARVEMDRMLELALRERVTLHFIDRNPQLGTDHDARLGTPFEAGAQPMEVAHTAPQHDLQEMAAQTGGVFLASENLFEALTQVRDLERGGYLLGYYLNEPLSAKQLAKVNVKTARKGVRLLHRRGYYAGDGIARSAGGSLVLGIPLSLEEDGRPGQFVPFTIVADPKRLGYELSAEKAGANLTLSVRVSSVDGRSIAETFHRFGHAFPVQTWRAGQAEPIEIRGWTECPPGDYRINVLLRNPKTGDRIEASVALTVPEGG